MTENSDEWPCRQVTGDDDDDDGFELVDCNWDWSFGIMNCDEWARLHSRRRR